MSSFARHSASSIAFHSRMGASTRGIALGSPHNSVRLHTSVWEKSPPLRRGSADSSKQRLQGFCSTTRTFLPPTERSNRGNTSVGHRTRVLQSLLPCSKERRRPEAHSGSAASEFFPLQREVQDADDENHHVSDSRRGLVCHYQPKGCIFSHPGRSATQEVPLVCLWREGLPIQGPALRPGLGAENVHEMHGCCTGPIEVPGHSCDELSGRLAHSGSLQGVSKSSQRYRSLPHSFSWPQNERQKECAPPISANRVSGGSLGFHSDAGPFGSCPDIQFYSMSGPLQARPSCLSRYLPQAARPHGGGLPCVAPRVASHEAVPLVDERAEVTPTIPATRLIRVSRSCSRPLLQWRDPAFLQSGVRMGAIHHRHMITTDASMTGWGVVFEGRPVSGEWTGEFLSWHISCLELRAVFLALMYFLPVLGEHHIIVRKDNMDDSGHRCIRPPVAECQSVRVSANKADSGSTMQSKGEQCPSPSHSPILALPDLVLGANSPLVSAPLGDSDQAGLAVPASGQDLASSTRALEVVGMAHTGPRSLMNNLPVEVQETIASARAPATRKLYSSKWEESW